MDSEQDDSLSADEWIEHDPSPEELAEAGQRLADMRARHQRETAAKPYLEPFFVWWDGITLALVEEFRRRLDDARREADMQRFLQENPVLLVQPLGGGHGRWVIPQKRLGAEHVPDFLLAEKDSMGFHWTAVELESPTKRIFTKAGEFTAEANHALQQIEDWRAWLLAHRAYAIATPNEKGLGLVDINGNLPGIVIMGRRSETPEATRNRRRERSDRLNIQIHTYDWLIDVAEERATWAEGQRRGQVQLPHSLRVQPPEQDVQPD